MTSQVETLARTGPIADFLLPHPHSNEMPGYRERFRHASAREELTVALYHDSFPPDDIPGIAHVYQEAFGKSEAETLEQIQETSTYVGFSAITLAKRDEAIAVTWWRAVNDADFYADAGQKFLELPLREHGFALHTNMVAVLPQHRNKCLGIGLRLLAGDYFKSIAGPEGILETSFISPNNLASEGASLAAGHRPTPVWHNNAAKRCWSKTIYPA